MGSLSLVLHLGVVDHGGYVWVINVDRRFI